MMKDTIFYYTREQFSVGILQKNRYHVMGIIKNFIKGNEFEYSQFFWLKQEIFQAVQVKGRQCVGK